MHEKLSAIAPAPTNVTETIDDLKRILELPERPPVDCKRKKGRYVPATQALIEVMTARFARPKRLSCACRPRHIVLTPEGALHIFRVLPEDIPPEPPIVTTVGAFVADNKANAEELNAARQVMALQPGGSVDLPAADGGDGHPCIAKLNAPQAWTLKEAAEVGGVVGFLGVGSGKTVAGILASLLFPDCKKAVLVIEPKQRRHYRSTYLRLREHFRVSSIVFDDHEAPAGYTVPGTAPLHLVSYSVLSQTRNSTLLSDLDPDTLILDEAHRACGDSAINRRVKHFILKKISDREADIRAGRPVRARAVRLLDWSGTLEVKGVADTHMLCSYSLGTGSPLPLHPSEVITWAGLIDSSNRPDLTSPTSIKLQHAFGGGAFRDLAASMMDEPEERVREGFRRRRLATKGIVSASAGSINAAIYFNEREAPKVPPSLREALKKLREEGIRPDGDILKEKIEVIATAKHIACGFYPYWAFPSHPCSCPDSGLPRCKQCLLIDDWYAKRKAFNKELRSKLLLGEQHLDTPKLCEEAAERFYQQPPYTGKLPVWECESWPAWRDIEHKVDYIEKIKWLDDFLALDAVEWAKEHRGVVWVQSTAFGKRVAELSGLPFFNGGVNGEAKLRAEKGDRSIICSIKAHGAGTDGLQFLFSKQLICELPASNASKEGLEQLLGRLHREGQRADVVETWAYVHVVEFMDALRHAYAQAQFNEQMTGNQQKILLADISIPGIYRGSSF